MNELDKSAKRQKLRWEIRHPGAPWPGLTSRAGKTTPEAVKVKQSQSHLGKTHTQETRDKMSNSRTGPKNPMYGKPGTRLGAVVSREVKIKMSRTKLGLSEEEIWPGFFRENTYCHKWTSPVLKIKKRVRAFFGNRCLKCGATKVENKGKHLEVHHIGHNKHACCEDNPKGWLFAPLCKRCHSKCKGVNKVALDAELVNLINTHYDGKCYYTLPEYDTLVSSGELITEEYGTKDGK